MKKFALAAAAAAAMTTAAPVFAEEATPADPFVSTQLLSVGPAAGLAIVGGLAAVVVITAAADSSDDT